MICRTSYFMKQHKTEMKILKIILCIFLFFIEQTKGANEVSLEIKLNMNTVELMKDAGYYGEQYETETQDGYILKLHRIPYGKDGPTDKKKIPVFLIHGIGLESTTWIDQGEKSLAYLLANKDYDVWLGNMRGNMLSTHKKYSRSDPRFWDFSWDDHAKYDLPSMWDFIMNRTNSTQMYGIGYSLGVAVTLANLADSDKYSSLFLGFFGMAPVSRLTYSTVEMFRLISIALPLLNIAGQRIFLQDQHYPKPSCSPNCTDNQVLLNKHSNSGSSMKTRLHGLQLINSETFSHFDYKLFRNVLKYFSFSPPVYDLTKVKTPVSLYSSANDNLADPIDVARLQMDLPNIINHRIVEDSLFTHDDFLEHQEVDKYVYNPMIEDMQSIQV